VVSNNHWYYTYSSNQSS